MTEAGPGFSSWKPTVSVYCPTKPATPMPTTAAHTSGCNGSGRPWNAEPMAATTVEMSEK